MYFWFFNLKVVRVKSSFVDVYKRQDLSGIVHVKERCTVHGAYTRQFFASVQLFVHKGE